VAIARALANEPKVILADEPTAALDTERGLSVMRLLRQITNEHGTATLVVTHDTRMIGEVDRVIQLQDGQVVDRREEALAR
jgi:putative ABC transport system ATP-binding protein